MKFSLTKTKCTATLLIWMLVYLLVIPTQLFNYVLCIGADGHVTFEISVNGQCTDTHAFHSEHITEIMMEVDHCGACLDLAIFPALGTDLRFVPVNDASTHPLVLSFALLTYQKRTSSISTFTSLQHTPPLIKPTLTYLRTTTLLI